MESYITNTSGLTHYSYEVDQLPRLTPEETARLGRQILRSNQGLLHQAEGMAARDALIAGHLHLVLSLAQHYPYDLREDLVQEGNIGLIEAVELYDFQTGYDFASYAITTIRHTFASAMESVLPIRIPRSSMRTAKARGTAHNLLIMQPISLDKPLPHDGALCLADVLPAPLTLETGGNGQEHTHAISLTTLLEKLPGLVRTVIELRYGLDEDDQRKHTYTQIASKLGISTSVVYRLEHQGLAILAGKHLQQDQLRNMAQESRLNAAYVLLQQSQQRISSRTLAKAAKVRGTVATAYLARIKQSHPQHNQANAHKLGEKTYTKLLHAYLQLQEQNDIVSVLALQKAAGVHWNTAKKFLEQRAQRSVQECEQATVCREAVEA